MLRFILSHRRTVGDGNDVCSTCLTIDVDVPELQDALESGGAGPTGFDHTSLIGVEILPWEKQK